MEIEISIMEAGGYILRRIAVLLSLLGITHVYHHKGTEKIVPNSLYVISDHPTEKEWGVYDKHKYNMEVHFPSIPCYDISDTMMERYENGKYDIAVTENDNLLLLYDAKRNVIYTCDMFHWTNCDKGSILLLSKLAELVKTHYPQNFKKDTPLLFHVDMGDKVIDLRTRKEYPKAKLTDEMKRELIEAIEDALSGLRT